MTVENENDQNEELKKIKSDPRYSDLKKIVSIVLADINENEPIPNKKLKENEPDNIFDSLAGLFTRK